MSVEIKELTIEDYEEIIRIWSIAGLPIKLKGRDSYAFMEKEIVLENSSYFGLYENETLIGVSIANYDGRRGWINRLAVDPDYRGKGYAGELIKHCEEFLHSAGAVVITALIEDINYPSISTFQKNGFKCEKEYLYFTKRQSDDL